MSEKDTPTNSEFRHEEGAPASREDWERLSEEDKLLWEQRRRRRKHLRRYGPRPEGLGQYVNPRNQSLDVGLTRGKGKAHANMDSRPLSKPSANLPEGKPLEPTREIPDSGERGDSGLTHYGDVRLMRRATKERWNLPEESTTEIPEKLLSIIHQVYDYKPETAIAAARLLKDLMGQNQTDEHEEIKRNTLTKEQTASLLDVLIRTIHEEVADSEVRQRINSRLGVEMVKLGIIGNKPKNVE